MKPDYKNWMPKGMIYAGACGAGAFLALYLAVRLSGRVSAGWRSVLLTIDLAGFAVGTVSTIWMTLMYRTFSYDGRRQLSRRIIEEIASHVSLPEGSEALDIGCGSGALTIACARRNPGARFLGVDRWGKEYASFSKRLCEQNAEAEDLQYIADVLHALSRKTIWRTFDSCNNYSMPEPVKIACKRIEYWYAQAEAKDRAWDIAYVKKHIPQTEFHALENVGHGGLAPLQPERLAAGLEEALHC